MERMRNIPFMDVGLRRPPCLKAAYGTEETIKSAKAIIMNGVIP